MRKRTTFALVALAFCALFSAGCSKQEGDNVASSEKPVAAPASAPKGAKAPIMDTQTQVHLMPSPPASPPVH